MAADWVTAAVALLGVATGALGVYVLSKAPRTVAFRALGTYLAASGLYMLLSAVPQFFSDNWYTPPLADAILITITLLVPLWVAFAVTYPYRRLDGVRAAIFAVFLLPALAIVAALLLDASWATLANGLPTPTARRMRVNLGAVAGLVVTLLFANTWLRTRSSRFRQQFFHFLVASLFWNLNDAVPAIPYVAGFLGRGTPERSPENVFTSMLQVAVVLGFLVAVASRASASGPMERRANIRLLYTFLAIAPLAAIQLLFPGRAGAAQILTDGIALPLVFYGATRQTVVSVELHMKTGIRGSVLGLSGLGLLYVIEQVVEQWVGSAYNFLAGLGAALVFVVFLSPLRRAAERISQRALPQAEPTGVYFAHRRREIYEVALEGMLRDDGRLDERETRALAKLRERLGISLNEHEEFEAAARARLAAPEAARDKTPGPVTQP